MKLVYSLFCVPLIVVFFFTTSGEAICHKIPLCKTCDDTQAQPVCTECWPPLYALVQGDLFHPCKRCTFMDNCYLCQNTSYCNLCLYQTYGPDLDGFGSCSPCASNCRLCKTNGGGKCDQCEQGYYLDPNSKTCLPGPPSCMQPTSTSTCSHCMSGYWMSGSTCALNPVGCKTVGANGQCVTCNTGLSLFEGVCLPFSA